MTDSIPTHILVAGATGALGGRVVRELSRRNARVTAIIRHGTARDHIVRLQELGAIPIELDFDNLAQVTNACAGAACVVSTLNGLRDTIIDAQSILLRAAAAAGVPRFIPSDFSLDFTRTPAGSNRNLDLRREFHRRLDDAPIQATSILNGGFMELLTGDAPIILFRLGRVLHWGDPDQLLDFTTMDDTAAYTAAAALDPTTPRILRIAGEQISPRGLAAAATAATGRPFHTLRAGGLDGLAALIRITRAVAPGRGKVFPPWQGMQYMRDMFSGQGKLSPMDNDRYPGLGWTPVQALLATR